jgi:hypothetical protein
MCNTDFDKHEWVIKLPRETEPIRFVGSRSADLVTYFMVNGKVQRITDNQMILTAS